MLLLLGERDFFLKYSMQLFEFIHLPASFHGLSNHVFLRSRWELDPSIQGAHRFIVSSKNADEQTCDDSPSMLARAWTNPPSRYLFGHRTAPNNLNPHLQSSIIIVSSISLCTATWLIHYKRQTHKKNVYSWFVHSPIHVSYWYHHLLPLFRRWLARIKRKI